MEDFGNKRYDNIINIMLNINAYYIKIPSRSGESKYNKKSSLQ